jgi:tungstate transport system ATP-binding protein
MNQSTAHRLLPLRVSGLSYAVGATQIISNISFSISTAGPTVVLGHNGAGKSVLLKLLHGMVRPNAGEIAWGSERLPTDAIRREQAMVFQKPVLLNRSVAANIRFALKLPHADRSVSCAELLQLAELTPLAGQPARTLSGGEQQRLAFARALAVAPSVLFLDEPTANLDPDATRKMEHLINRAARRSIKIFMVTHDLGQARRLASEIVFLNDGTVEEHRPADAFFNRPDSAYCQSFIDGHLPEQHG